LIMHTLILNPKLIGLEIQKVSVYAFQIQKCRGYASQIQTS
jgi:hypothetical protein